MESSKGPEVGPLRKAVQGVSMAGVIGFSVAVSVLAAVSVGWLRAGGLSVFDDPGSAADWVAALGTWAVGLAAFALAASDRRLKLHERREQKMLRLKLDIARVRTAATAADSVVYKTKPATRYLSLMDMDMFSLTSARAAVDEIRGAIAEEIWTSEDEAVADDIAAEHMARAEISRGDLLGFIDYLTEHFMSPPNALEDSALRPMLLDVAVRANQMIDEINRVFAAMKSQQLALMADRDRLAKRLEEEFKELL